MKRRDTLKTLIAGAAGSAVVATGAGCKASDPVATATDMPLYGRTPEEIAIDKALMEANFFSDDEMKTLNVLCDIILPADNIGPSASSLEVPAFIDFMAKDYPDFQLKLRGGLMWLNSESNERFGKIFRSLSSTEQLAIIDDIAYPNKVSPDKEQGASFFSTLRNLTMTGYYTTKVGVRDVLGYKGNVPNIWDGVPPDVLAKHDVEYDQEWLAKCVDQDKRDVQAEWDDDMNLIS